MRGTTGGCAPAAAAAQHGREKTRSPRAGSGCSAPAAAEVVAAVNPDNPATSFQKEAAALAATPRIPGPRRAAVTSSRVFPLRVSIASGVRGCDHGGPSSCSCHDTEEVGEDTKGGGCHGMAAATSATRRLCRLGSLAAATPKKKEATTRCSSPLPAASNAVQLMPILNKAAAASRRAYVETQNRSCEAESSDVDPSPAASGVRGGEGGIDCETAVLSKRRRMLEDNRCLQNVIVEVCSVMDKLH